MNPMHSGEDSSALVRPSKSAGNGNNPLHASLLEKDKSFIADAPVSDAKVGKGTDGGVFGSYSAKALVFFAIFSAAIAGSLPSAGFFIFVSK